MFRFIVVAALVAVCLAERKSYDGYTVLRVTPNTGSELNALKAIKDSELGEKLDFWVEPSYVGRHVDIMVSPLLKTDVTRTLSRRGIKVNNWIEDVQNRIEQEQNEIPGTNAWGLTKYNTYAETQQWITDMAETYPFARKGSLGASFNGLDIGYLRLSKGGEAKNAFVFTSGMHAREWISPATIIYMTDLLLKDSDTSYLDNLDIYIIPVLNPDGYSYTWTNDRMWRKNRNTNDGNRCTGVDLNRNWPVGFGGSGSSGSMCSETYRGPTAISEPESKALNGLLLSLHGEDRLKGYIDFHAYSQMWMTPWGYSYSYPSDYDVQLPVAEDCAKAIEAVYGKSYLFGTTSRTVYIASGVIQDYTYGDLNVIDSYGVELRDTGTYGFLLPSNQIEPSGIETYPALKLVMDAVIKA